LPEYLQNVAWRRRKKTYSRALISREVSKWESVWEKMLIMNRSKLWVLQKIPFLYNLYHVISRIISCTWQIYTKALKTTRRRQCRNTSIQEISQAINWLNQSTLFLEISSSLDWGSHCNYKRKITFVLYIISKNYI
jgi:hypothetical protein